MTARTLALEALKACTIYACAGGDGAMKNRHLAAISALEAETGEPAAWIDPRDLAVLACPGVKEFGHMRYAGVSGAQNSKSTLPLYTAPAPAVPQGWKLVPIEPTPEMWKAGLANLFIDIDAVWAAMLEKAPKAPA